MVWRRVSNFSIFCWHMLLASSNNNVAIDYHSHAQEYRQEDWNHNSWLGQRVRSKPANGAGPRDPGLFCPSAFALGEAYGGEHKRPAPAVYSQAPFPGWRFRSWFRYLLRSAQSRAPQMSWLAHSLWVFLPKSIALHLTIHLWYELWNTFDHVKQVTLPLFLSIIRVASQIINISVGLSNILDGVFLE